MHQFQVEAIGSLTTLIIFERKSSNHMKTRGIMKI